MEHTEAVRLIKNGIYSVQPELWADLGCGSGTFTLALAEMLTANSKIIGIDISMQCLPKFINKVEIQFMKADVEKDDLLLPKLDGILMANSFHYIMDKISFIRKMEDLLDGEKQFLIIEYNTQTVNRWVPYPISFLDLSELFFGLGYSKISKLEEINSAFGGTMYAAMVQR